MTSKIILQAEAELQDTELRKWVQKLESKIQVLNDRTKRQTMQINKIENRIILLDGKLKGMSEILEEEMKEMKKKK